MEGSSVGHGRTHRRPRLRAVALTIAVLALLGVFYAVVAVARTASALATPSGHGSIAVTTGGMNGLSAAVANMAAGDRAERTATVENRGSGRLQTIQLTVSAAPSSQLDRDAQFGLRIRVDRCSAPWVSGGNAADLRCPGRQTELLGWKPVASGGPWDLGGLAAGATEWLCVTLQLPADAPARLEGRSSALTYRFTAQ